MRNMRLPSAYSLAQKSEHQASLGTYSLIVAVLRLYFLTGLCCQVTSSIMDRCTLALLQHYFLIPQTRLLATAKTLQFQSAAPTGVR